MTGAPSRQLPSAPVEVVPSGPVRARLAPPPSKSVTNRALVLAALAEGESILRGPLESDDTDRMAGALRALGVEIEISPGFWRVRGTGGRLRTPPDPIDAGLSGTTMRFVVALAALAPRGARIVGRESLMRRPVGPLVGALRALGAEISCDGDLPPVVASGGGLGGGEIELDASRSSQFVTAVLLAAPYARADVTLRASNLGAGAYVDLTVQLMREWGAEVERLGEAAWCVTAGRVYGPREYQVEYDASAAAHLFALAMTTGGSVSITNARATLQPDAGIAELFGLMGGSVSREGETLTLQGPPVPAPIDVDLSAMPDQLATVAAVAALAPGRSSIRNVEVARLHEVDRIRATAVELRALGAEVEERPDGIEIAGGAGVLHRGRIATRDDHRIAMAFAALGARVPGIVIEDPASVAKTYPAFWEDLGRAGVSWRPVV